MKGRQCQRLLWFAHQKRLPDPSIADQHKFDQGYTFESHVKKLFPHCVELGQLPFNDNITKTKTLTQSCTSMFEAGFHTGSLYVRADILEYDDGWNLYEIKASSDNKKLDLYSVDLAFQKYVIEQCGVTINKCYVLKLNKEYVKQGPIDPVHLVEKNDVTENVELIDGIEEQAQRFLQTIQQPDEAPITISVNCNKPYTCPLKTHCWGTLPEDNVLHLTNWRQYWKFFHDGIIDMNDIPNVELKPQDEVIKKAALGKQVVYNKEGIQSFLKTLQYPLYHLDFETFDTAVPIYDNSSPYQKIVYQYSLHIEHQDGSIDHHEFLADGTQDPRVKLLDSLKQVIRGTGSVVVFNQAFEKSVLTKLGKDFPEHNEWIQETLNRIIDLAVPFRNFHYYCSSQKGSYSIKKVLPAITGEGYDNLEINNGADASVQYYESHIKHKNPDEKLRKDMLDYCGMDTMAMVRIIQELKKLV